MPGDLVEVLVNMAMASPAVCALRMLDPRLLSRGLGTSTGKNRRGSFNNPEAIAIVDLSYGQPGEGIYWKHILRTVWTETCAVLDEYSHMLMEGYDYKTRSAKSNRVLTADMIRTSRPILPVILDTYQIRDRVRPHKPVVRPAPCVCVPTMPWVL